MKTYKYFIVSLISIFGCGVKGSPEPPEVIVPPKIVSMNIKQQGNMIVLFWKYNENKNIKQKIFLNGHSIKTDIYKKDNLYWIDYRIKNFNEKYCFYINTTYKGISINSPLKCISPAKYKKINEKITLEIVEDGILIRWKRKYRKTNIYRGNSYIDIKPVPYVQIKNDNVFLDKNVNLNKYYCYYITISDKHKVESNRIYSECIKFEDKFPPNQPKNVGYLIKGKELIIVWQPPEDKDIKGFIVLKNGKPIFKFLVKSYFVKIKDFKVGDIFEIISIDRAGNKSKPVYLKVE